MQTPAPVDYRRATSVEDALRLLEELGPEALVIAGGHSLLPMMRIRLARPECLVDINHVAGLDHIRVDGDQLVIGALARHAQVLASPVVAEHYAILADAERVIADPVVREWGTVGGSLCQADPAEDLSAVMSAVQATCVLRSSAGERTVPVRELHVGPYETVCGPAEILTEVRVPIRPGAGSAYAKVERRAGDWATAASGAYVVLTDGTVSAAGIGLAALGAAHSCAPDAEAHLVGKAPTDDVIDETARRAAAACQPVADQRGPVDYKRHLAEELTRRVLRRSVERSAGRA